MVFSSTVFLFAFLPLVIILHSCLLMLTRHWNRSQHLPNIFLFAASLFFYTWGESYHTLILILCVLSNYYIGKAISKSTQYKKLFLGLGITSNLLVLIYFKYSMLLVIPYLDTLNTILPFSISLSRSFEIILPIGISFYIFQAISYLIDVSRKTVNESKSVIDFGCYLTMFPQLIAGPIVRYSQVHKELSSRSFSVQNFSDGISRFIIGLAKKVLIADTLGRVADAAFAVPAGELSTPGAWLGIMCYTFQIYYDFSGYSDMAIGIGKMLGFTFPQNFNYPYIANSIQNFWQRWHISLSTWFRDYLYIPLGGNREGDRRTYFNLFIVFALCGFWHGASWTFMAWGCYYGFFLVLERKFPLLPSCLPGVLQHLYVMVVVIFGWVLFRADTFAHAMTYYKSMFGMYEGGIEMNRVWLVCHGYDFLIAVFCATLFSTPVFQIFKKLANNICRPKPLVFNLLTGAYHISLITLLLITFMPIFGASYTAFIYFRF